MNEEEFRCAAKELYDYWGFDDLMFANTIMGANAVIAEDDDKVIVAVRGTQTPITDPGRFYTKSAVHEIYKGTVDLIVNLNNLQLVDAQRFGLGFGRAHRRS